MRWIGNFLAIFGVLLVLAFGVREIGRSRSYQFAGELVDRVETDIPVVALTFDDGPTRPALDELLPMLAGHDVKASFFVIGRALEQDPDLGRRIVAGGHELGNHSYSHQRMILKGMRFMAAEIERTDELIQAAGYDGPIHFRPPYGHKLVMLPLYLAKTDRVTITWDVEPDSFPEIADDPDAIARFVLDHVRPGSIILLHPMYRSRAASLAAVPKVIEELKSRGYRFVTVSELLGDAA